MNQYIKSFEEFKTIYTSPEFEETLKEAFVVKKRTKKMAKLCLIFMPLSFIIGAFIFLFFNMGLIGGIIGVVIATFIIVAKNQDKTIDEYSNYYKTHIPQKIGELSDVQVILADVDEKDYLKKRKDERKDNQSSRFEEIKQSVKDTLEYDKEVKIRKTQTESVNKRQFEQSHIVEADKVVTESIAEFKHKFTKTNVYYYSAWAYKETEYVTYEKDQYGRKREVKHTDSKLLTSGTVLSIDNLENINLDGIRILIKDDDTLISHITENTVDAIKKKEEEIKFNRIDLNKSFDCFVYNIDKKEKDIYIEALKTLTPVVEDLLAYIRKKYGRYNLAINNNKIDIEFLDYKISEVSKKNTKGTKIKPKLFSDKDLKISYLCKFYELIEIQKIMLKYLSCYPKKYPITDSDVQGLKDAVESSKIKDEDMDMEVKDYYEKIVKEI